MIGLDILAERIVQALWFIAPAYVSNATPPVMKGKRPVDFGKKLKGERIFGDGKTIEGSIGGVFFGSVFGFIQLYFQPQFATFFSAWGIELIPLTPLLIVLLSIGAIIGDMIGSFVKRRFRIPCGEPAPLLDQLDFLAGALLLACAIMPVKSTLAITLVFITPIIHWLANLLAYYLKIKKVPW